MEGLRRNVFTTGENKVHSYISFLAALKKHKQNNVFAVLVLQLHNCTTRGTGCSPRLFLPLLCSIKWCLNLCKTTFFYETTNISLQ